MTITSKQITSTFFATLLCFFAVQANAVIITFDETPAAAGNPLIASYSTGGFTVSSSHMHQVSTPLTCSVGGCVDNGTQYLTEELPAAMFSLTGVSPFSLISFDGAEVFLGADPGNADFIEVTGNLSGGGMVSAMFNLDGIRDGLGGAADFQTFLLPNTFTNLVSVDFQGRLVTGALSGSSIDNLVLNEVPEPTTLVLLGIGLAGLGFSRRNRA